MTSCPVDPEYLAAEHGCRDMLRRMIRSGQHYWRFDEALTVASYLGMPWRDVRSGIGAHS